MPCLFNIFFYSVRRNDVTEIGECTLDPIIAPGDVLPCNANDQLRNFLRNAGSTWSLPGISPFLRDALTMPGKQRIRCHQRFDFSECLSAKIFSFHGQPDSLFIGEPKTPSIKLIFEHAVFFDQVVDDSLLVAVEPAGQRDDQKLEGVYNPMALT